MGDLVWRVFTVALGALFVHDAVWWKDSWFFGRPMTGGWWKRQSETAQILYRLWLGGFGFVIIIAAVFGSVVH